MVGIERIDIMLGDASYRPYAVNVLSFVKLFVAVPRGDLAAC